MKTLFKIRATIALWLFEKSFGEDFFDDFPEAQKHLVDKLHNILK